MRFTPFAAFATLLTLVGCSWAVPSETSIPSQSPSITWRRWEPATFAEAKRVGRPLLVDVGIEGCTACRWMAEDTYRNVEVVARVNEHFIAVQVDANVRPDLGARFSRWGWPATIVLAPDGAQLLAVRGNKRPRNFIPMLDRVIAQAAAGTWAPLEEASAAAAPATEDDLGLACSSLVQQLRAELMVAHTGARHVSAVPHLLLLGRAHTYGERDGAASLERAAEAYQRMIDPVWGGIFLASLDAVFERLIVEKRTVHQAWALRALFASHHGKHEGGSPASAHLIWRYLSEQMRSADGTFYATQEDEAPLLPVNMSAADYYQLDDAHRRCFGVPPVDHGVYTDINAEVIVALAEGFEATGESMWLDAARTAANAILSTRMRSDGAVEQSTITPTLAADRRMRAFESPTQVFLAPNVRFAFGLLALYRVTQEPKWLEAARRVVHVMRSQLEDPVNGGFYPGTEDGVGPRSLSDKPVGDNALAARVLLALGALDRSPDHVAAAERTLRAILNASPAASTITERAELITALQESLLGPLQMTLVGATDDAATQALLDAATAVYEPRKLLHFDHAGDYPTSPSPALYVCTRDTCSSPLTDPSSVPAVVADLGRVPHDAPCRDR